MNITARLSVAFFLMATFTALVGALGLLRLHDLDATLEVITSDRFHKLEMARRGVELIEENARLATLIFIGDPAQADTQLAIQQRRSADITALYKQFDDAIDSPAERAAFELVKTRRATYVEHRARLEEALQRGATEARTAFQRDVLPELLEYLAAWDALVRLESERVQEAVHVAEDSYTHARQITLLLVLTTFLLGLLVTLFILRRVARPLRRVARAAEQLEKQGSTDRLVISSHDEIGTLARAFNTMSEAVTYRQERLKREMEVAQRIQTALLPRDLRVKGLEVAASMRPATEVGGDYYDVVPLEDGAWFGIGDVAGHGVESGLLMLMIQSSVLALVGELEEATPAAMITAINRALHQNLRDRMLVTSFATLALFRYRLDGTFVHAGRHEEILLWRKATQRCEIVPTAGTWAGLKADVASVTKESTLRLDEGDLMVLFTDGIIEARNKAREEFGIERVRDLLQQHSDEPVDRIRERILAAVTVWEHEIEDDASLIVLRRRAPAATTT